MVKVEYSKTCDLCSQNVEVEAFILTTKQGQKLFCCAGCQSLYQLLNVKEKTFSQNKKSKKQEDSN